MKINYVQQIPYRHLPSDFEAKYESVVTTPYNDVTEDNLVAEAFSDAWDESIFAARAGFDALIVTEHAQSSYDMMPNPDLFAAALACWTQAEGIDTGIYPLGRSLGKAREPLRVAEEQAMLDCMSGGRLIAGFPVGLAYDANINNSVPPAETRQRFDENLELILRAWTEDGSFAWNGKFSQYMNVNIWPRPIQRDPHPPVWITAIGNPATMEFILRRNYGFNYFGWFGAKKTGPRIFDRFRNIAEKLGKSDNPYQTGFLQTIAVADTDAKAEKLYKSHAEYFFRKAVGSIPVNRLMLPGGIDIKGLEFLMRDPKDLGMHDQMRESTYKDLVESGALVSGSPDTVADQLAEYAKEFRIGNLHAMLQFGSMSKSLTEYNIDLFSSKVMPKLKSIWEDEGYEHYWWPRRLGGVKAPEGLTEEMKANG